LAVFVGTCYGVDNLAFKADYTMRNENSFPNGYVTGTVYYSYVWNSKDKTALKSRIRFETNYRNGQGENLVHVDLFHYENGALYSICSSCDAAVLADSPELWLETEIDQCTDEGGYRRCTRPKSSVSAYGVVEFVAKGTPGTDYDIKYIRFSDGREFDMFNVEEINRDNYADKLELAADSDCPKPVCRSFIDVVFVLDASESVKDSHWKSQKKFLKKAVEKFKVSETDAHVGIVEFASPWQTCSYTYPDGKPVVDWPGWKNVVCYDPALNLTRKSPVYTKDGQKKDRMLDDCAWDTRCNNVTDTTATIFLNLTHVGVDDMISTLPRIKGHTCQRYGLHKAYDMLFTWNPRCSADSVDRSECPLPVVIVVTDGEDLCYAGTMEWANKIKNKDKRGILLEVGVGLKADYDEEFLRNLSSVIGDQAVSYNVDDYAKIETILDKLMAPACSMGQLGSGGMCGASCKGYCACGECFCPSCASEASSICNYYECVDVSAENGCREKDFQCSVNDTRCFTPRCDATETDHPDEKCKADPIDCRAVLAEKWRPLKECEYTICYNGCDKSNVFRNQSYCVDLTGGDPCKVGICDPENSPDETGCVIDDLDCSNSELNQMCKQVQCIGGKCTGSECETACTRFEGDVEVLKCPPEPCMIVTCDENATDEEHRCIKEPFVCSSNNKCKESVCQTDPHGNNYCVEFPIDAGCSELNKNGGCRTYSCDASVDNGDGTFGACVATNLTHELDACVEYTCGDDDMWVASPKCPQTKVCKISRCSYEDGGSCYEVDYDCHGKVKIPNKCFEPACREPDGCYKKQYRGAYFDVCGNCISDMPDFSESEVESVIDPECALTSEEEIHTEGLAAAAIALIVIGCILIGAAVSLSGVVGTKALLDRAHNAADQAVVSNPLFEGSQTEMANPAFVGNA